MKYEVVPNSCRICLRKCKKLRSIYRPLEDGDESPYEMLKCITGIREFSDGIELPQNICKGCELSLNLAFQFRMKALKSQRIIEVFCSNQRIKEDSIIIAPTQMINEESNSIAEVKEEDEVLVIADSDVEAIVEDDQLNTTQEMKMEELELPLSDDDPTIEYIHEDSLEDYDAIYSSEDETPLNCIQTSKNPTVTDGADSEPDNSEPVESIEDLKKELHSLEQLMDAKEASSNSRTPKKRGRKPKYDIEELKQRLNNSENYTLIEFQNAEHGATSTLKLLPKKSGRPKINDESGHICDICGNIFAKRGRMMEHRRRHDKELRFACELCDKRFHLREKLRKHMFSHKGGKPFQCSFCSRTFFYESVRKAHEAVHKGFKPYVCEICNKPFAYSHALKKHKLIHAEIKLYHCEYCDKDFRLQHHMKQHEETKMHQNAVKSMETANAVAPAFI